jgi:serine/threonine-protein kinase
MSPESSRGDSEVDGRADIYSVGVMLFEMCVGHVPFSADNYLRVLHAHISDPPPSPRAARADLPEAVEQVVLRALAKEPADRFQTADELADALIAALPDVDWRAPLTVSGAAGPRPMGAVTPTPRPLALALTPRPPTPTPARLSATPPLPLPAPPPPAPAPASVRAPIGKRAIAVAAATALIAAALVAAFALKKEPAPPPVRAPAPASIAAPAPAPAPVPAPAPPPTVAPAPAATDAELSVDSTPPGATVILDGERIGETPLSTRRPADGRRHTLRVELAGYRADVRDLVFDQSHAVAVALRRTGKPRPLDLKEGR